MQIVPAQFRDRLPRALPPDFDITLLLCVIPILFGTSAAVLVVPTEVVGAKVLTVPAGVVLQTARPTAPAAVPVVANTVAVQTASRTPLGVPAPTTFLLVRVPTGLPVVVGGALAAVHAASTARRVRPTWAMAVLAAAGTRTAVTPTTVVPAGTLQIRKVVGVVATKTMEASRHAGPVAPQAATLRAVLALTLRPNSSIVWYRLFYEF